MHLIYRKTCRICGSSALTKVISLGAQHLQGSFIKPGRPIPPLRRVTTELMRCDPVEDETACGLLQTTVTVPPEILYASYWYRSGTNQTMCNHLQGIAYDVMAIIGQDSASVLDIGCNDGTLLKFYPSSFNRVGIDPSDIVLDVGDGVEVIQDFFPSAKLGEQTDGGGFDVITSIAMFYDLEDPVSFVEAVRTILSRDGIWLFEMSYMPDMLRMNSYDTICHEHIEYYSLTVIEHLLRSCGLKVVRVAFNAINGGSIRCYATHVDNFRFYNRADLDAIDAVRRTEFELELDTDKPYRNFQERIDKHKTALGGLLRDLKRDGKTILQWCGIDNTIVDFAADRNPEKDGAKTISTEIPIISEEKSRELKPDFYLVLPWHFREEFLEREKATRVQGTKLIFPLPEIEIVE